MEVNTANKENDEKEEEEEGAPDDPYPNNKKLIDYLNVTISEIESIFNDEIDKGSEVLFDKIRTIVLCSLVLNRNYFEIMLDLCDPNYAEEDEVTWLTSNARAEEIVLPPAVNNKPTTTSVEKSDRMGNVASSAIEPTNENTVIKKINEINEGSPPTLIENDETNSPLKNNENSIDEKIPLFDYNEFLAVYGKNDDVNFKWTKENQFRFENSVINAIDRLLTYFIKNMKDDQIEQAVINEMYDDFFQEEFPNCGKFLLKFVRHIHFDNLFAFCEIEERKHLDSKGGAAEQLPTINITPAKYKKDDDDDDDDDDDFVDEFINVAEEDFKDNVIDFKTSRIKAVTDRTFEQKCQNLFERMDLHDENKRTHPNMNNNSDDIQPIQEQEPLRVEQAPTPATVQPAPEQVQGAPEQVQGAPSPVFIDNDIDNDNNTFVRLSKRQKKKGGKKKRTHKRRNKKRKNIKKKKPSNKPKTRKRKT